MNLKKLLGALVAAGLMVGVLAGPAAAVDAGVFTGQATVGKLGTCQAPQGAGLGLPIPGVKKNAWWHFQTVFTGVNVLPPGPGVGVGELQACGALQQVGRPPVEIGAACGMSKGHSGEGFVRMTDGPKSGQVYPLHDLQWKATVGGTLPVTGRGGANDLIVSVVQAQGAGPCLTKAGGSGPNDKVGGATSFMVIAGVFDRVPNAYVDYQDAPGGGPNDKPVICKDTENLTCAYKDKKYPNQPG